ncbi:hypothetical protein DFH09DRAFT_1281731 [Mycena vulgaris]|nr:hypothetical protein DFH09DRAFT_1281731 [Mycena vulgaris]
MRGARDVHEIAQNKTHKMVRNRNRKDSSLKSSRGEQRVEGISVRVGRGRLYVRTSRILAGDVIGFCGVGGYVGRWRSNEEGRVRMSAGVEGGERGWRDDQGVQYSEYGKHRSRARGSLRDYWIMEGFGVKDLRNRSQNWRRERPKRKRLNEWEPGSKKGTKPRWGMLRVHTSIPYRPHSSPKFTPRDHVEIIQNGGRARSTAASSICVLVWWGRMHREICRAAGVGIELEHSIERYYRAESIPRARGWNAERSEVCDRKKGVAERVAPYRVVTALHAPASSHPLFAMVLLKWTALTTRTAASYTLSLQINERTIDVGTLLVTSKQPLGPWLPGATSRVVMKSNTIYEDSTASRTRCCTPALHRVPLHARFRRERELHPPTSKSGFADTWNNPHRGLRRAHASLYTRPVPFPPTSSPPSLSISSPTPPIRACRHDCSVQLGLCMRNVAARRAQACGVDAPLSRRSGALDDGDLGYVAGNRRLRWPRPHRRLRIHVLKNDTDLRNAYSVAIAHRTSHGRDRAPTHISDFAHAPHSSSTPRCARHPDAPAQEGPPRRSSARLRPLSWRSRTRVRSGGAAQREPQSRTTSTLARVHRAAVGARRPVRAYASGVETPARAAFRLLAVGLARVDAVATTAHVESLNAIVAPCPPSSPLAPRETDAVVDTVHAESFRAPPRPSSLLAPGLRASRVMHIAICEPLGATLRPRDPSPMVACEADAVVHIAHAAEPLDACVAYEEAGGDDDLLLCAAARAAHLPAVPLRRYCARPTPSWTRRSRTLVVPDDTEGLLQSLEAAVGGCVRLLAPAALACVLPCAAVELLLVLSRAYRRRGCLRAQRSFALEGLFEPALDGVGGLKAPGDQLARTGQLGGEGPDVSSARKDSFKIENAREDPHSSRHGA